MSIWKRQEDKFLPLFNQLSDPEAMKICDIYLKGRRFGGNNRILILRELYTTSAVNDNNEDKKMAEIFKMIGFIPKSESTTQPIQIPVQTQTLKVPNKTSKNSLYWLIKANEDEDSCENGPLLREINSLLNGRNPMHRELGPAGNYILKKYGSPVASRFDIQKFVEIMEPKDYELSDLITDLNIFFFREDNGPISLLRSFELYINPNKTESPIPPDKRFISLCTAEVFDIGKYIIFDIINNKKTESLLLGYLGVIDYYHDSDHICAITRALVALDEYKLPSLENFADYLDESGYSILGKLLRKSLDVQKVSTGTTGTGKFIPETIVDS